MMLSEIKDDFMLSLFNLIIGVSLLCLQSFSLKFLIKKTTGILITSQTKLSKINASTLFNPVMLLMLIIFMLRERFYNT